MRNYYCISRYDGTDWKPTPRAQHIDSKYHVLCQWIEQDLIKLERISLKLNVAYIFTKQLGPLFFFCGHSDYVMGWVPLQYLVHYNDIHLHTIPERFGMI